MTSTPPSTPTSTCVACGAYVRDIWPGCLVCGVDREGQPLDPATADAAIREHFPATSDSTAELRDRPVLVLVTIFGAMMFLGIPLIWTCRGFSTPAKIFWTIATLIYSVAAFYGVWLLLAWAWRANAPS